MRAAALLALAALACTPNPAPGPTTEPVDFRRVDRLLDSAITAQAAPGAVLGVSWRGVRHIHAAGTLGMGVDQRPDARTVYDLASLTKVVGLTTAVMLGVQDGVLELDAPAERCVPDFRGAGKDAVTLRHLLTHSSGLRAWRPLFQETGSRMAAFALADTTPLDTLPGAHMVYSDIGAIVLTQCVERVYRTPLDSLLTLRVFSTLGLEDTRFLPPSAWRDRIAPTENDSWRGRVLRGEVHDENAARLDGVSGHAGLFSSTRDLLTFGESMLEAWHSGERGTRNGERGTGNGERGTGNGERGMARAEPKCSARPEPPVPCSPFPVSWSLVREFTRRQEVVTGSSRALGWDTPSSGSSAGTKVSSESFGHTGFTGTSIWIDPTRQLVVVLLANRVHPTRDNPRWGAVRGLVADQVVLAVDNIVTR